MGLSNFRRNLWLASASTLIMTITLIILSVLSLLFVITNSSVKTIQQRVDISAYFKNGLAESQINVIRDQLSEDSRIAEVNYVPADVALANFKDTHKNDALLLESVGELSENPLPATLQIKAKNLDDYPGIADTLNSDKYHSSIDKVNFEDNRTLISRLNNLLKFIVTFGIILIAVFSSIAVLVIFNTITLTIYNRREEVEIMRLVGATNWYIRGPFIVEALLYSILATLITGGLLFPVYRTLLPKISHYLTSSGYTFNGNLSLFFLLILAELVVAFVLSVVSSLLAMRRYLRV
ncbi:MAG TPA: permease-like cell division protein FtsX [Patescibacteria group bacterium]|jgi:cell division transport system permease protein|nr:permease-like cell division protein FtsX [Patescibacteria group bacterium]